MHKYNMLFCIFSSYKLSYTYNRLIPTKMNSIFATPHTCKTNLHFVNPSYQSKCTKCDFTRQIYKKLEKKKNKKIKTINIVTFSKVHRSMGWKMYSA